MAEQADDEFFSDDDLDNLNPEVLDGLEHQAIQFTQHQQQVQYESSDYGDDIDDEDLEDAEVVVDEERTGATQAWAVPMPIVVANASTTIQQQSRYIGNNTISKPIQPAQSQFTRSIPQKAPQAYSQYPTSSASRHIPLAKPSIPLNTTPRDQFRQQRYGNNVSIPIADRSRAQSSQQAPRSSAQIRTSPGLVPQRSSEIPDTVEALQRQLQQTLKERDSLKQDVNVKAGEIAIVRSKQEKAAKEHERELATIRKLNAEELAKQKRAVEQIKDAERKVATELAFAKHDLAEEAENLKKLRKVNGTKLNKVPTTPTKKLAHRDGFDDDEVQLISPSKFRARISNPGTPTKAPGKRKRKATGVESPIGELEVHVDPPAEVEVAKRPNVIIDAAMVERLGRQDDRLDVRRFLSISYKNECSLSISVVFAKHAESSTVSRSYSDIRSLC